MKYTGMAKTKRDNKIKAFKAKHPEATFRELGKIFNLSYEQVRQILLSKDEPDQETK